MSKIIPIINNDGTKNGYAFFCPGCGHAHKFTTDDAMTDGWPVWIMTGTEDKPTVRASILNRWGKYVPGHEQHEGPSGQCHLFITDGRIEYCGDCTHSLNGQTIELPEFKWS